MIKRVQVDGWDRGGALEEATALGLNERLKPFAARLHPLAQALTWTRRRSAARPRAGRLDRRVPRAPGALSGPRARRRPARSPPRCPPRRRRSPNRSTPSWPTSSGCSCPASPTGTIRASSPTSPSPAARRACSPISCRPRSTSRRCCGARRRRRPSSRRSRSAGCAQLIGLPDAFEGVIYDTASICDAARARRGARGGGRRRPRQRTGRPHRRAAAPRLLLGAGAFLDRQGGDRHRPRATNGFGRIPVDADFRMRVDALADAHRRGPPRRRLPIAVVATVGTTSTTSVDPVPAIADSARANSSGCTSTPRTPASRHGAVARARPGRRRSRRLAIPTEPVDAKT